MQVAEKQKAQLWNVQFQKISIPIPRKVNRKSKGQGAFKSTIFKGKCDAKLEFREGWGGVQSIKKNLSWGVWIFSGATQCSHQLFLNKQRHQTKLHVHILSKKKEAVGYYAPQVQHWRQHKSKTTLLDETELEI